MAGYIASRALSNKLEQALLTTMVEKRERGATVQRLLAHYLGCSAMQVVLNQHLFFTKRQEDALQKAVQRIKQQEPVAYVTGLAPFLGQDFHVNPSVLIPRPETEELVQHIITDNPQPERQVLDIGTGSGCIAITLFKQLKQATVWALEVDADALQTARINANLLQAPIHFLHSDILKDPLPPQHWDVLVSNPPYVRQSEKPYMASSVYDYEPTGALFVPDSDPLLFYKRITVLAQHHLTPGGKLYFEINEALGKEVVALLQQQGFSDVRMRKDLHDKDRWVAGQKTA